MTWRRSLRYGVDTCGTRGGSVRDRNFTPAPRTLRVIMEKGRFKKLQKKKRHRDASFLMYFPYAETLVPFQPAGLKRRGAGGVYAGKGIVAKHSRFTSKDSFASDEESDEDLPYLSPVNLSTNFRTPLCEDDVQLMERVDFSRLALCPPTFSYVSHSSSYQDSESPPRVADTQTHFLGNSPLRSSKGMRKSHAEGYQEDSWDRRVRGSATPTRACSAPKTDPTGSMIKLPQVRKDGLANAQESNTHSTPALVVPAPPANVRCESQLCESESMSLLPEKPKTSKIRVRKHKPMRAQTKSPRPKTSSQVQERRITTAVTLPPTEGRIRPGPPAVAEKTDNQYREAMIDVLLRNKTCQDHAALMQEYLKRSGLPEGSKVFIINSQDDYMRRALKRRNWVENKVVSSSAFHLKWTYTDSDVDYRALRPGQMFNHFGNNRRLTTKCGLNSSFRSNSAYALVPDEFYPRTYDLGDATQLEEFKADYERTAVFNVLKSHYEYFQSLTFDSPRSLVNKPCLKVAIKYCLQLLSDYSSKCEHSSKYSFVPDARRAYTCTREEWKLLMEYSRLRLPAADSEEAKQRCTKKGEMAKTWVAASEKVVKTCREVVEKVEKIWPQMKMEGTRNAWIVKPGQNARGSGVHCSDDLQEILDCGTKLQARIVQKYIERPFLICQPKGPTKFDIRQWVLVSSLDPLEIYCFNSCYIRLCTQPFTLDDLKDKFSHLANYSVQKTQAKTAEETVWSLEQFLGYLREKRPEVQWERVEPLIHSLITQTLFCVCDDLDPRSNSFELYGFDIILDDWLRPWLLEVNLSPACAERTPWLTEMLDSMASGLLSIVLGEGEDSSDRLHWVNIHRGQSACGEYRDMPCSLEIVGEKVNLRKERMMDRRFVAEQAAELIQKFARGFLVRVRNRHARRHAAATYIQRHAKGFLARQLLAKLKESAAVQVLQRVTRRWQAEEVFTQKKREHAAVEIQAMYRRWKANKAAAEMRQVRSADRIQRVWRRKLAKWLSNSHRLYLHRVTFLQRYWRARFRTLSKSVTRIQSLWRGVLGRRAAVRQRHLLAVKLRFQSVVRMLLDRTRVRDEKLTHSACVIQSVVRRTEAAKVVRKLKELKAIVFIQRWYKSYKSRKIFLRMRRAKLARIRAAIRIQATIKGHSVRLDFQRRKQRRVASVIQCVFRSYLSALYLRVRRTRHYAAVTVQRFFRGFLARKRLAMWKRNRAQEKERARRKEVIKAEKKAKALATSDRLAQRTSEMAIPRLVPAPIETSIARPSSTVSNVQRVLARRRSARPTDTKRALKGDLSPQPWRQGTLDGLELLPRPKTRVKTALQDTRKGVR